MGVLRHILQPTQSVHLEEAAEIARRRAGLPATAPLIPFPRISPIDRIRPASSSEDRRAAAAATTTSAAAAAGSATATQIATLFAESWGPVWQLAARCGLPAAGPLTLPGSWTIH